jgi:cytosine/adenosine deaminase-related metal-dependent hydrolase
MSRILIKNGAIVSMDRKTGDLRGDLLVENDCIAAIGPAIEASDAEIINASTMIVIPGLINSHIHTWETGLRGIAGDWTMPQYGQAMHRGLATHFQPDDIYIANLMGALTSINSGITTIVDWCHNNPTPEHTDAAIDGLQESGVRAVFLHGSPKPNPKPGQKHFSEIPMPRAEVERLLRGRLASHNARVTLGLAILGPTYSIYEVARQDLQLARELDLVASMHVSGVTPVSPDGFKRIIADDLASDRTNIVHGNDLTDEELRQLTGHGVQFTVTADVELQMGFGNPLTGRLRALDAPMSVGSDVEISTRPDMFGIIRTTLQTQRNIDHMQSLRTTANALEKISITCRDALAWATVNGAKMVRLDHRIGSLATGKQADIVLIRKEDLNMLPVHDPLSSLVTQAGVSNVDTVLIGGRVVKRDGQLLYVNIAEKKVALQRSGERILRDLGVLPRAA